MQDYLEQGEQDRQDLVSNLTTKGITGLTGDETFTTLVPEVLNIPSGGDPSEYFETEPETMSANTWVYNNFIKGVFPSLTIPSSTTSLSYLFKSWQYSNCPKVICGNNVTNMSSMFMYGTSTTTMSGYLTQVDLSGLNTTNVTTMSNMFAATKITSINASTFVTTNLVNLSSMFNNCQNLTNVDLSSFEIKPGNLDFNLSQMFYNCTSLTNINFGNKFIDALSYQGSSASLQNMFQNCSSLTTLDLSSFKIGRLRYASGMFNGCTSLTHIDIRNFVLNQIITYSNMFGTSSSNGVPDNCEIIVADDTQKTWITTNFSRLTNVKTVAEYEA